MLKDRLPVRKGECRAASGGHPLCWAPSLFIQFLPDRPGSVRNRQNRSNVSRLQAILAVEDPALDPDARPIQDPCSTRAFASQVRLSRAYDIPCCRSRSSRFRSLRPAESIFLHLRNQVVLIGQGHLKSDLGINDISRPTEVRDHGYGAGASASKTTPPPKSQTDGKPSHLPT